MPPTMLLHRKLFPSNSTTTTGCPYYLCPTTSCISVGCYYSSNSTSSPSFQQTLDISPLVIIVVALLVTLFLLVSYYAVLLKYCSRRGQHLTPVRQNALSRQFHNHGNGSAGDSFLSIDNPIWHGAGLEQSTINAITTFLYKIGEGGALIDVSTTECSVCLAEFADGEKLKLLPKCNHAFHAACVDIWLRSHTNCPLCRAEIIVVGRLSNGKPSNGCPSLENISIEHELVTTTTHSTVVESRNDGVYNVENRHRVGTRVTVEASSRVDGDQSEEGEERAKEHHRSVSLTHLDSLLGSIHHSSHDMDKVTGRDCELIVDHSGPKLASSSTSMQSFPCNNNRSCIPLTRSYSCGT